MTPTDKLIGADLGGRFRVERFVANEMLGRVYAVRGLEDGKLYHAKVPHASVEGSAEKSERFRRELHATSLVSSPHTVHVVDTGLHGDLGFLVFEYLAATPLQKALEAKESFSVERVASIVAQVARALEAAHLVGVVHRNLSPQTILLLDNAAQGDFVKVSDFGLSRLTDEESGDDAPHVTQAGTRIGNILYMAPEYIELDLVHPRGDVYALGAVAFHLLTGQPPFTGKASEVLSKHVTDDPPRAGTVHRDLPRWMDDLVASLLAKDPEHRPDPATLVRILERGVGRELRDPRLLGVDTEGAVIRPSRAPMIIASVGAVVLGLGAVLFVVAAVVAGGTWAVYRLPDLVQGDRVDLQPLPDASLPGREAPPPTEPGAPGAPRDAPSPKPRSAAPVSPAPAGTAPVGDPAQGSPSAPEQSTEILKIRSAQRAVIWVDGRIAGYTPIDQEVDPGTHRIVGMLPGKPETRQEKDVEVDGAAPMVVEFKF